MNSFYRYLASTVKQRGKEGKKSANCVKRKRKKGEDGGDHHLPSLKTAAAKGGERLEGFDDRK